MNFPQRNRRRIRMLKEFCKRFVNYGSMLALLGIIGFFLPYMGIHILPSEFEILQNLILSFFIYAGVINNPASGSGYKDE